MGGGWIWGSGKALCSVSGAYHFTSMRYYCHIDLDTGMSWAVTSAQMSCCNVFWGAGQQTQLPRLTSICPDLHVSHAEWRWNGNSSPNRDHFRVMQKLWVWQPLFLIHSMNLKWMIMIRVVFGFVLTSEYQDRTYSGCMNTTACYIFPFLFCLHFSDHYVTWITWVTDNRICVQWLKRIQNFSVSAICDYNDRSRAWYCPEVPSSLELLLYE